MKNIKIVLIILAVVLGAFIALSVVGLILNLVQYVFWLGIIGVAGFTAIKLFGKSEFRQIENKTPVNELENARRELEEYKRKYLPK